MGTHIIYLYKVDKKDTSCNFKTMKLLDCALVGVYAVIRSNTLYSVDLLSMIDIHVQCFR